MTLRPETALALERGRVLYNAARYYEAHEVWEEAWLGEQGEARLLLQGLIQVAAGYFKALAHRRPGGSARGASRTASPAYPWRRSATR
jgi:uncharacterized protein